MKRRFNHRVLPDDGARGRGIWYSVSLTFLECFAYKEAIPMRFRTLRNAVAVVLLCAFLTACAAKPSASGATWAESAPQGGKIRTWRCPFGERRPFTMGRRPIWRAFMRSIQYVRSQYVPCGHTLSIRRERQPCSSGRGVAETKRGNRSLSCGKGCVYDGSVTGTIVPGNGMFAQMLLNAGIPVMTEEEFLTRGEYANV